MAVYEINTDTFETEVLKADGTVLVDFSAVWCGPCKMLAPIVDEFAEKHSDIKVCKVDIDESYPVAFKYQVAAVPTLIAFRNGEPVAKSVGLVGMNEIENLVK